MRVLWLPEALADLERLYNFLVEKDPTAAARAMRTIDSGADCNHTSSPVPAPFPR